MAELFDVALKREDRPLTRSELAEALRSCDVLVPTVTDRLDGGLIEGAAERLKLIANFGAGTDHIDLDSARAKGLIVTNTPGVLTDDTADLCMALILSVPRRLGEGEKRLRAGQWTGWAPTGFRGHSLTGKKLGIYGMGRIGRAVAVRARACGLSIHYHNRSRLPEAAEKELEARFWPDLDSMLGEIDILSINAPHSAETHHTIDARRLSLMKPHSYVVNAARGGIVDEDALIDALAGGRISGAGLDVYSGEPAVDPRLHGLGNVVLLPHMGSATFEGRVAMGERVIANIAAWADGRMPPDRLAQTAG